MKILYNKNQKGTAIERNRAEWMSIQVSSLSYIQTDMNRQRTIKKMLFCESEKKIEEILQAKKEEEEERSRAISMIQHDIDDE